MVLSERIKSLRNQRGWSQAVLAERSGLSQTYISDMEQKGKQPTYDTIVKLAFGFGISVLDFLGGDKETEALPSHLRILLDNARQLNPEQVDILNQFIKSITDSGASDDALLMVAEPLNKYESIAASGSPDPMKDLPQESISQIEELQRDRFKKYPKK